VRSAKAENGLLVAKNDPETLTASADGLDHEEDVHAATKRKGWHVYLLFNKPFETISVSAGGFQPGKNPSAASKRVEVGISNLVGAAGMMQPQ